MLTSAYKKASVTVKFLRKELDYLGVLHVSHIWSYDRNGYVLLVIKPKSPRQELKKQSNKMVSYIFFKLIYSHKYVIALAIHI